MKSLVSQKRGVKGCISFLVIIIIVDYFEEPRPTYEPQKKIANKPIASIPTTVPTSHKGIRPVVPMFDINENDKVYFNNPFQDQKYAAKSLIITKGFT